MTDDTKRRAAEICAQITEWLERISAESRDAQLRWRSFDIQDLAATIAKQENIPSWQSIALERARVIELLARTNALLEKRVKELEQGEGK